MDLQMPSVDTEYVRGLCTLARNVGWQVLAQGVDTQEQLATLGDLGFDGGVVVEEIAAVDEKYH
jgi:EAL domain-containing protein (putative c-di-GMP-specific phosphodiesterase class I)